MTQVVYGEWGLANHFGEYIELHKDLKKYPEIERRILEHENNHSEEGYNLRDVINDFFKESGIGVFWTLRFCLTRPKTWIQILPFQYRKRGGWFIDWSWAIIYMVSAGILGLAFFTAKLAGIL